MPRARSDEAEAFFVAVYEAVQEVPHGRVTSYGHIAKLAGYPTRPRQVGVALKHLPTLSDTPDAEFHGGNVPWQRIINSQGVISRREQTSGASRQAAALRAEGVEILDLPQGELGVDFGKYGWFPKRLPSREGEESDEEEEEEE